MRFIKPLIAALAHIRPRTFYIVLAVILTLYSTIAILFLDNGQRVESTTYDWMIRHRFISPTADNQIVILDIDERSLAKLSNDFGRWPWPRAVLGEVLTELERQGARAILFDVLFADPDSLNPDSEKAFSDAVAASQRSYFPILRLNPDNDKHSQIHASQLPGALRHEKGALDPTLSIVPPYFDSIVRSQRMGYHNIYPDHDGVVRHYRIWEKKDGWQLLSLPARVALDFGALKLSDDTKVHHADFLLNWPKRTASDSPLGFKTISFADLYLDMQRKQRGRASTEFTGKIVLIGATAPSLFDIKGSSLAPIHPGIDILATALDNTINERFIYELPAWIIWLITTFVLVLMTWLVARYSHEQLAAAFVVIPTILLGLSFLSLHIGHWFIDLTAPASMSFWYLTISKTYGAIARQYWGGEKWTGYAAQLAKAKYVYCLVIKIPGITHTHSFETRFYTLLQAYAPRAKVALNIGKELGWAAPIFHDTIVATWLTPDQSISSSIHPQANNNLDVQSELEKFKLCVQQEFKSKLDEAAIISIATGEEFFNDEVSVGNRDDLVYRLLTRTLAKLDNTTPQ